jgi:hypothetical protein
MSAMLLLSAPGAQARWNAEHCSLATESHCYAITQWVMSGTESVKGAQAFITTNGMNVPEWAGGSSFVDDEMWLSFPNAQGGWLEIGQTAGAGRSCCTLHPFIAHSLRSDLYGYEEFEWYWVEAASRNLYQIVDPSANGTWCEYTWETAVDCHSKPGYWTTYATELQAGIEAAADNPPHPENSGSQEVDAIERGGGHRAWQGAHTSATWVYTYPEMCIGNNPASNYPGNAIWLIC